MNKWIDCGSYWLNNADQRSQAWHKNRSGRVTASNFGTAAGYSKFSTPEQLADEIAGIAIKEFSEQSKYVMNYGTVNEPNARDWYEKVKNVKVKEVGLAVPKWNPYIGGSVDGYIEPDGMIEIKCPLKMYKPLKEHMDKIAKGWKPPKNYREHIWPTHYSQMQGCMKIMNLKYCDYVVYCIPENKVYEERIPFDPEFWDELYGKLNHFVEKLLIPRLIQQNISLHIPN